MLIINDNTMGSPQQSEFYTNLPLLLMLQCIECMNTICREICTYSKGNACLPLFEALFLLGMVRNFQKGFPGCGYEAHIFF